MPLVSKDRFQGIPNVHYNENRIHLAFVKDEFKLAKVLTVIFDGDGTSREYHCCEVDMAYFVISSWDKRDLLPQLQEMEDSGVRQGSLKDAQKEQKKEDKAAKQAKKR
ncbi:uncharacterized protein FMAN_15069 [Fusarium mangiferae]|uniref:Uncharacterized protein n=1 Tax=Fusarium mangiferae TaxID=192010 RepID=A0A1L7TYN1_FUSMA|nr:uncharacterized protein FMAN_15069 [Fusarium mangiferae]CVL03658.1 uncharacterized protein FMAN_15069 [Fusarium mangiferae]